MHDLGRRGGRNAEASAWCFAVKGGANSKDTLFALRPRLVYCVGAVLALLAALVIGVLTVGGAYSGEAAAALLPRAAAAAATGTRAADVHVARAPLLTTPTPPTRQREALRRAMGACVALERFVANERPLAMDRLALVSEVGVELADLEAWALEAQRNISQLGGVGNFFNAFDKGFARRRRETLHRVERAVDSHYVELTRKRDVILDVVRILAKDAFYPELDALERTLALERQHSPRDRGVRAALPSMRVDAARTAAAPATDDPGGAAARSPLAPPAADAAERASERTAERGASPRDVLKLATFFDRVESLRGVAFPGDMRKQMEAQIARLRAAAEGLDPNSEDHAFELQVRLSLTFFDQRASLAYARAVLLCTVTYYANRAHSLTRSP